jgi:integrase
MAQLIYRVTGRRGEERVFQTFRNTDEGRKAAAVLAGHLDSARTVYDVRTRIGGRVVTRTFKRRKDADAYASTVEADKLRGVVVDPRRAKVTVEDYTARWLAHRSDLAVRTTELYRWLLDHQILPTFGTTPLADLSPSSVRSWHARIAAAHPTTAAKAYRLLSSIMRTAVTDEVISRNPCQVKGAAVEKAPERPVASIAEVQALANSMPEHLSVVVLLAAWCQLRRAELRGLRRRDVDLMRATLTVSVTRTTKMDGTTVEKAPKTDAGRRTIAIPANVVPALTDHLQRHVGWEPDALIIDCTDRALGLAWDKARHAVGRPDLRLHDLRHTGLTWSAATGASVAELMRRAGHKSPAAAMRYQHATENRDRVLADALAELATVTTIRPRDSRAMKDREGTPNAAPAES